MSNPAGDRILGSPPRSGEPITTVEQVKGALSSILTNNGYTETPGLQEGDAVADPFGS